MGFIQKLAGEVKLPCMVKVSQDFDVKQISPESIPALLNGMLQHEKVASQIKPGAKIAITCGSRGIDNIVIIIRTIVKFVQEREAIPVVVAAMGSHGGATAEGQREILCSLGITESSVGCRIETSMETILAGYTDDGRPIYVGKAIAEADGVIASNRIKPHTSFRGKYESGLMKMLAIGMTKQLGAEHCHAEGFGKMAYNVEVFGRGVMEAINLVAGIAIIENATDTTAELHLLMPSEIEKQEPLLLERSRRMMPRIWLDNIDVLVVDETGKNISGDGMDPNITGTFGSSDMSGGINAQRVVALDLTKESHGSAVGIGMAHAITRRFYEKIDFEKTYPNLITTKVMEQGRIPMVFDTDKQAIQIALRCCLGYETQKPRIIRIKNTLHLKDMWISEALVEEALDHPKIHVESVPQPFDFDEQGNLF